MIEERIRSTGEKMWKVDVATDISITISGLRISQKQSRSLSPRLYTQYDSFT